ncbi:MAG: hypothetical protein E6K98_01310 [Thaumarchaeota archaeon]|nr:MAG: hypothetical protein E6K98_01310 [Nitrososphaerota archaeon]
MAQKPEIVSTTKASPKEEVKPEIKVEVKPEPKHAAEEQGDPFAGIATNDIEKYSDLFDVLPPENDDDARRLAATIRKWISNGRPKPKETTKEEVEEKEEMTVPDDEKPKKSHSLFGWKKK